MQVIKSIFRLCLFVFPTLTIAQSTYITQGDKAYDFIDRVEIKLKNNNTLNQSSLKPYNRKYVVQAIESLMSDSAKTGSNAMKLLTSVDAYNLESLYLNNAEWVKGDKSRFVSKKSLWGQLYQTKANLLQVKTSDLFLTVDPILNYQKSFGSELDKGSFINTRGVVVRGLISKKIGFSSTITDNQQQGPAYFNDRVNQYNQVPHVGFWKPFKNSGFDYFDARGYVSFQVAKTVDVQFGYDNNIIGNGYRSLFLSDYANSYIFLKLNVRKGKFEYQTLFNELLPSYTKSGDVLLDRKYGAFYHIGFNAAKWLNIGAFEGVIFGNKNDFGLKNVNPLIFSRHIAGFDNSPDNAIAGLDVKANILNHFQVYGQLLLDEFKFSELSKNNGYWANKTGYQAGVKYIDAFGLDNLDLQVETNKVRPFTYAYNNNIASYTHYNLPLAHPLGANFQEFIGILKYQPLLKWRLNAVLVNYKQGLDSMGINFGSNPFENTLTRKKDQGYKIKDGNTASVTNVNLELSYELRENLFLEGGLLHRSYMTTTKPTSASSNLISFGIRWNLFKTRYDL